MLGFGNSVIGMGVAIRLHDMFTNTARTVSQSMVHLESQGRALSRIGGLEVVGAGLASIGMRTLGFFKEGIGLAAEYEKSLAKVSVELEGYTGKDRILLDKTIDKLSVMYGLKKNLLAQGAVDIARQGVDSSGGIANVMTAAAMLARSTDLPVQMVADHLGDMMMMFNKGSEAALGFADRVAYAANKSNVEVGDIFKSVSYLGPAFRIAGATAEEALAIVAALGNAGIKSSRAGTSINQWITQLANAVGKFRTDKQATVFKKWGLSVEDVIDPLTGKTKNLVEIMSLLGSKALNGTLQGVADVNAVFNSRGGRALAAALANPVGKDLKELYKGITGEATGFATKVSDAVANSPQGRLDSLEQSYINFKQKIGEAFMGLVTAVAPALIKVLDLLTALANSGFGKVLAGVVALAAGLAVVAGTVLMIKGGMMAWSLAFSGINLGIMGAVNWGKTLMPILSAVAPILTFGRVTSGLNPKTGAYWFRAWGMFANWKTIFQGGWVARGISYLGQYISSIGWLTNMFPALATAGASAGSILGSASWASLGPWGLLIGLMAGAITYFDAWADAGKMAVDALIGPFIMLYAAVKSVTDALAGDFSGPMDDYENIMRSIRGKYSWEEEADKLKASQGYTPKERDAAIAGLKITFPNKSNEELGAALARMYPDQKPMDPELLKKGGYSDNGEWIHEAIRTGRSASTNLNVYIDGKNKINREISKTMDQHISADE